MDAPKVKIGLIQAEATENIENNLELTARLVAQAAKAGAKIICLHELFATPYFAQQKQTNNFTIAQPIPGHLSEYLTDLAKKNRVTLVGGSIFERAGDDNYYNTALIIDPTGNIIAKYRKMHIPHDPLYYEQFYFKPGDLGYVMAQTEGINIAPLICYDQWFPEPARILAMRGAQLILYPTAIGWTPQMKQEEPFSADRWEQAMRAHASMNGIYVAAVNRVGIEGEIAFWGGSFVADPFGQMVARASAIEKEALIVEIDCAKIINSQEGWRFKYNRRPETYNELCKVQKQGRK